MSILRWLVALTATSLSNLAQSTGLGAIELRSALGQPLHAEVLLNEATINDLHASCIHASVETLDGTVIAQARAELLKSIGKTVISINSSAMIAEPAIAIGVELTCGRKAQRRYELVVDLPASVVNQQKPATSIGSGYTSHLDIQLHSSVHESHNQGYIPTTQTVLRERPFSRAIKFDRLQQNPSKTRRLTSHLADAGRNQTETLKLSEVLSYTDKNLIPSYLNSTEKQIITRQFSSLLAGEDPYASALKDVEVSRQMLKRIESETKILRVASAAKSKAYSNSKHDLFSGIWLAGFLGTVSLSFGTVGWLAIKLRVANRKSVGWMQSSAENTSAVAARHSTSAQSNSPKSSSNGLVSREHNDLQFEKSFQTKTLAPVDGNISLQPLSFIIEPDAMPSMEAPSKSNLAFLDTIGELGRHNGTQMNVEEVSDIVQEAEFWMMLNDYERALHLLEPQADIEKPDSPVTWLYLIDLYRHLGICDKYQALAQRFKKYFNVRLPAWEEDPANMERTSLEDFPGLLDRITNMWSDKNAAVSFLESLLIDDRNGERIGFDLPVYKDIILLIGVANESARLPKP